MFTFCIIIDCTAIDWNNICILLLIYLHHFRPAVYDSAKLTHVAVDTCRCIFNQADVFYTIAAIIMCRGMCQHSKQAVVLVRWTSQTLFSYHRLPFVKIASRSNLSIKVQRVRPGAFLQPQFAQRAKSGFIIISIYSHFK